jgi:hypothetical protein
MLQAIIVNWKAGALSTLVFIAIFGQPHGSLGLVYSCAQFAIGTRSLPGVFLTAFMADDRRQMREAL